MVMWVCKRVKKGVTAVSIFGGRLRVLGELFYQKIPESMQIHENPRKSKVL